jgi:hypothetical protein
MWFFKKIFINKRALGIAISAIFLILIVILSAIYIEYSIYGIIICIVTLFIVSYRMHLFQDIDLANPVTKKNSNIKSAIIEICSLLSMANHSVIITSGSLNEKIWGAEQTLKILEYLNGLDVKIFILTGKKLNISKNGPLYEFIKKSLEEKKLFYYIKEPAPDSHFIIIDETHLRLEDKHSVKDEERTALITYHRASLAGRAKNKFENLKIGSQIITDSDFEHLFEKTTK